MIGACVDHGVDEIIVWQGDESQMAAICNEAEVAKVEKSKPGAVEATREQLAPEAFGSQTPVWDLPPVQHASRMLRRHFGDLVVAVTQGVLS